jgi:predicted dehydrogenase
MEPVRAALIGCGSISQRGILPHLALSDAREVMELVAVCDVVGERARETAERFGVPRWYRDANEAAADAAVEAVLIATPIPFHFSNAMAAVEAGKHVYLQKTMTTTVAEADELLQAARRRNVKVVASPGQMLGPVCQRLRQAIGEGIIGLPYWALASTAFTGHEHEPFRAGVPVDPTWYYKPGGGPVFDMAVYTLHLLTGLLGPAKRVTAMSGIGLKERAWPGGGARVEMDDNTLLLLDFDGCYAAVGAQFSPTSRVLGWGFTGIYGSGGTLEITGLAGGTAYPGRIEVAAAKASAGFREGTYTEAVSDSVPAWIAGPHAAMEEAHVWADIRHLADCIRQDREPAAGGEHARHVIEIIERGYRAARTGRTQNLRTTFRLPASLTPN